MLPGVISWNLVILEYQEFVSKYSTIVFVNFQCPSDVVSLLFLQLYIYHYPDIRLAVTSEIRE